LADAGGRIWDFGKRIRGALRRADDASKHLPVPINAPDDSLKAAPNESDLASVVKSVERMVSTAADANSGFEIRIEGVVAGSPTTIAARYTPAETRRISKQLKRDRAARKRSETGRVDSDEHPQKVIETVQAFGQRIDAFADSASEDELREFVALIADTVKTTPGGVQLLEQLAIRMELGAKGSIARMIWEHVPPKDRTPRLTPR
jgi:hypothetical protein